MLYYLKAIIWLVTFAAVFRDVRRRSPSFRGSVDYHLASAMDSHSRSKGTCIVLVVFWSNFIYLFQLVVAMIYKGRIELLIADIELELMYSVVPLGIGYFLLATYCCACSDFEEPEFLQFMRNLVSQA